jgi:hypothetical protein
MRVGSLVKPKTFADVQRPVRQQPLVANVRFVITHDGKTVTAEAKFQAAEPCAALYTFLEANVFASVEKIDVKFMTQVISRGDALTLASQKIAGPIMLNVFVTGKATLKI